MIRVLVAISVFIIIFTSCTDNNYNGTLVKDSAKCLSLKNTSKVDIYSYTVSVVKNNETGVSSHIITLRPGEQTQIEKACDGLNAKIEGALKVKPENYEEQKSNDSHYYRSGYGRRRRTR